jgi:hypothetical protein
MKSGTRAKDGIGISALTSRHENSERQADHDRESETEHHPVERKCGMLEHASVSKHGHEGAPNRRQRGQQRRREVAASRHRLIDRGGSEHRKRAAHKRSPALSCVGHDEIMPQRTTV